VHDICDRIVVLFRGRVVASLKKEEAEIDEIVRWITGAALASNLKRFGITKRADGE
jgi:ABC-type sugar transport system ATPase subunit